MHAAQEPADAQCDRRRHVGLRLYGVAKRFLERACGLPRRPSRRAGNTGGAFTGLPVNVLGGTGDGAGDVACFFASLKTRLKSVGLVDACVMGFPQTVELAFRR